MIAPIRDNAQNIIGVVRIFLNREGDKLKGQIQDTKGNTSEVTAKANLGLMKGGAVFVQKGVISDTLWVAEGIETALSIARAKPAATVLASLSVSQLKGIPIEGDIQKVVICADNDDPQPKTKQAILTSIEHHLSKGRRVFIAMPEGAKKCDYNDLLKQEGIQAVRASLDKMVEIKNIDSLKVQEPRLDIILQKMRAPSIEKNINPNFQIKAAERQKSSTPEIER